MESQRLRIQDRLEQFFGRKSSQLVNELAWRFHKNAVTVQEVDQIVDMLILPGGIHPPTYDVGGIKTPYAQVSRTRLLEILLNVTMFDCGVQQLLDLAQLCNRKKWHLCFLSDSKYHNESHSLTADQSRNYNYSNMLYVYVPDDGNNNQVHNRALNVAMLDQNGQLTIQRIKLIELLGDDHKKVDGYCIGHELSHANANAVWHEQHTGSNPLESTQYFLNAIKNCLPGADTSVIANIPLQFLSSILANLSEAMNVLKLGHDWSFNGSIIGEFDFLCETKGEFCVRIPYDLELVGAFPPKLTTAFCTLILKLKQQSITTQNLSQDLQQALTNLKNAFQEHSRIQYNLSGIKAMLSKVNYERSMVPQFFDAGSGKYYSITTNSGFHAILEALNPTSIDSHHTSVTHCKESAASVTTNRQIAVEILRQDIADLAQNPNIRNMPNTLFGSADLPMEIGVLQAVATLLQNTKSTILPPDCSQEQRTELQNYENTLGPPRALIVIDAAKNEYTCIDSNLKVSAKSIDKSFAQMLRPMKPPPVVLLYQAGCWQAWVPKSFTT
jgi:uncharacterized protein YukE